MGTIKTTLKWLYMLLFYLVAMVIIVFVWTLLGAEFRISDINLGFILFINGTVTGLVAIYNGK